MLFILKTVFCVSVFLLGILGSYVALSGPLAGLSCKAFTSSIGLQQGWRGKILSPSYSWHQRVYQPLLKVSDRLHQREALLSYWRKCGWQEMAYIF